MRSLNLLILFGQGRKTSK